MGIIFTALTALLPAFLWAAAAIRFKQTILSLCGYAIGACIAIFCCSIAGSFLFCYAPYSFAALLFNSFIAAGLVEESGKLAVFYSVVIVYRCHTGSHHTVQHYYTAAVFFGLVFGGLETLSYMLRFPEAVTIRLFGAVLLHGALASFYLPAVIKTTKVKAAYLCIPVLFHGLYNMFLSVGGFFTVFSLAILLFCCGHAASVYCNQ